MDKNIWLLLVLTLSMGCNPKGKGDRESQRTPNIVLFLVDDMGWQDTSVPFWDKKTPFNERYHTPNMERLASEGMKFTQAYATPVCSPTRISLMTGMNAARHRVTNWTLRKDALQPMEVNHKELAFPRWNVNGLCPHPGLVNSVHADALPKLLKKAGYFNIHVGKAHFGAIGTPAEDPKAIGFDINIAGHAAGAPQSYLGMESFGNSETSKDSPWPVPNLEKYHGRDIFLTEALTLEAKKTLNKVLEKDNPFFLYMSHYAVHTPITADKRYLGKYLEAGLDSTEAKYATLVEGMDKSLGDIMAYLEEKEIAENTIILFMSDNGGLSAHGRGGKPNSHNLPLASGKGSIYEGGIREPMIVKWPGVVEPGSSNNNYLIIEDFFPSILEMAGVGHYNAVQTIDGKSFVPLLTDTTPGQSEERPLFWHYPNQWGGSGPGIGAFSAVRLGDWKLIYYHLDERYELFNIEQDLGETTNLTEAEPDKCAELSKVLSTFLKETKAQLPSHKRTGKVVSYP
ncbi:sulfatase [Muricauda sp. SCSIO 64092]|uniref:sulfatase n=1 Tax=Allomuricauda sp. SCSIO 64092 TaxID=2908842 RepID=UPI001FF4E0D4|nr:sulfatase [Muricauda sp. SCSIO 64092]UOY04929.1 sulfatase [Muricauda sp. SCSIO 64092]